MREACQLQAWTGPRRGSRRSATGAGMTLLRERRIFLPARHRGAMLRIEGGGVLWDAVLTCIPKIRMLPLACFSKLALT